MALQKMERQGGLGNTLQGVSQLLSLFTPQKKTTGGSTETTATNMSMEGLDAVLRQILESTQGLAAVSRGQRNAGIYNSSVNTLLTNDLLTRAAGEVAKINAPTTRTTSPRTDRTEAPLGIPKALALLGTGVLANKLFTGAGSGKSAGIPGMGTDLGTGLLKGAKGASGLDLDSMLTSSSSGDFNLTDIFSSGESTYTDGLGSGISFDGFGGTGGAGSSGISAGSAIATLFNLSQSDDKGATLEQAAGGYLGNLVGGPIGGIIGSAIAEPVFEAGYDILGGVKDVGGDLIEGAGDLVSSLTKSIGCYITTATVKLMGKADDCDELTTLRAFRDTWLKENHPEDIQAYYDTAPVILDSISKLPTAEEILKEVYSCYILPAVQAVKEGKNEEAYIIYRSMVLMLSKAAGLSKSEDPK